MRQRESLSWHLLPRFVLSEEGVLLRQRPLCLVTPNQFEVKKTAQTKGYPIKKTMGQGVGGGREIFSAFPCDPPTPPYNMPAFQFSRYTYVLCTLSCLPPPLRGIIHVVLFVHPLQHIFISFKSLPPTFQWDSPKCVG